MKKQIRNLASRLRTFEKQADLLNDAKLKAAYDKIATELETLLIKSKK